MLPKTESFFRERCYGVDNPRPGDQRNEYQRDRARVIHSAGFRRLQGKTQVMGVGEGDFHRTRLTHSIECAQIGYGIVSVLQQKVLGDHELCEWLPHRDLIEASCFAHDLGHPPYGHGGERALYQKTRELGGFEGNGQTLRILTKLEKYRALGEGINPTRRLVLAVLKYPKAYSHFQNGGLLEKSEPPKCYYDDEQSVVEWALSGFSNAEKSFLGEISQENRPKNKTFDCSIMELADDIAYGVHDLEDIVARSLASRELVRERLEKALKEFSYKLTSGNQTYTAEIIVEELYEDSRSRKQHISKLVNLFVTNCRPKKVLEADSMLVAYNVVLPERFAAFLRALKKISYDLVVEHAKIQQLEFRGQRVVADVYDALMSNPSKMIPESSWCDLTDMDGTEARHVSDYLSGMTDSYAEKIYHRLYSPGIGSSSDEL